MGHPSNEKAVVAACFDCHSTRDAHHLAGKRRRPSAAVEGMAGAARHQDLSPDLSDKTALLLDLAKPDHAIRRWTSMEVLVVESEPRAAAVVAGALRAFDRHAPGVDVACDVVIPPGNG